MAQTPPPTHTPQPSLPTLLGPALILLVGCIIWPIAQTRFGLWEPWETTWAQLARTMLNTGDWFTPRIGGEPVSRPLLSIWLIALGQSLSSTQEWLMRFPTSAFTTLGALALYTWLSQIFGKHRATLATLAAMTCPHVILSSLSLSGNGVFLALLTMWVAAYGTLTLPNPTPKSRTTALFSLPLITALCVFDQGAWGAFIPLSIPPLLGLTQYAQNDPNTSLPKTARLVAIIGGLGVIAYSLGWGVWQEWNLKATQTLMLSFPTTAIGIFCALAWGTPAIQKHLKTLVFSLFTAIVSCVLIAALFEAPTTANTTIRGFAGLHVLLENHLTRSTALPDHVTFDFWIRQLGFSAFPWTVLVPFSIAWLVRSDDHTPNTTPSPSTQATRLIALWFLVGCLAAGLLGTLHEVYLFCAVPAMGIAASLMLSDGSFWNHLRNRPALMRALGFASILGVLFLSKDLERYPKEILGPLLTDGSLTLPEDFSLGRSLKTFRTLFAALLTLFFMGIASIIIRIARTLRKQPHTTQLHQAQNTLQTHHPYPTPTHPNSTIETSIRYEPNLLGRITHTLENPTSFTTLWTSTVLVFSIVLAFVWVPNLSHHLSIRSLLESYQTLHTNDQPLWTYQIGQTDSSFYLSDTKKLTQKELKEKIQDKHRHFFLIPRDRLSSVNYELRKPIKDATKRPILHVLDDRSSRYLLTSNTLQPSEPELSPIAHAILPATPKPRPRYLVTAPDTNNKKQFPQFDKRIQLLGYELYSEDEVDRWGNPTPEAIQRRDQEKQQDIVPKFATGDVMVLRYFFKVLKRPTSSFQIFLHVDYPGTRINGDHYPIGGDFPTNHWLPGDYVVNTQRITIERGSSSGFYTLNMGFFSGSRRMEVTPRKAHDGQNRINMGRIKVGTF